LRLSRNFGHQAALSVGLAYARGQYIGIMDCDLQDPIEVLVELYRACLNDDLDVCLGLRRKRDAPFWLRAAYSAFYYIIERAADHEWPRDAGDFCVFTARCQRVLLALPEQSRMLRGLRSWIGFRQAGIPYDRPMRQLGTTKYTLRKLTALALQGLISFSTIPLRLSSIIGVSMGIFSVLFGILILINRLFRSFSLLGYWVGANAGTATVLVFLAFALSVLFVCVGIVGEYLIVLLQEIKRRPAAIVASVIGELQPLDASYGLLEATQPPAAWMARTQ
jgi:glycosyltransferase involved in cell wall biosynthesis